MVAANMIAFFAALLAVTMAAHPNYDPCQAAYTACNFRFHGSRDNVPTFKIGKKNDAPFTPPIVWKNDHERIGIVNSNSFSARFIFRRSSPAITHYGSPRFVPTAFKPYAFRHELQSGIGHQAFQGNQLGVARGKCVKVILNFYQLLGPGRIPSVITNINDSFQCVVFRTA